MGAEPGPAAGGDGVPQSVPLVVVDRRSRRRRPDLLAVAMREVTEETGLQRLTPVTEGIFSLECLTVDGHEKRGSMSPATST